MIGLTHSQPATGALILAQAEIKLVVIKSIQMGRDFRQPFGPNLPGLEGSQTSFLGPYPTLRCRQSR